MRVSLLWVSLFWLGQFGHSFVSHKVPHRCFLLRRFSSSPTNNKSLSSPSNNNNNNNNNSPSSPGDAGFVKGPDLETKPDYENIHGPLGAVIDKIFLTIFRSKMAEKVGVDSKLPKDDYNGLMELAGAMNSRYSDRTKVSTISQDILRSLFPSWLPGSYAILFSKPFPEFSARMNAWATWVGGTWLMGECEINDIEIDGKVYKDQGLLVKRCRFLEESGCASVCVNACKIPTQNFFIEDMGLPLTMTPDYTTHECQFAFGRLPTQQEEIDAKNTPCLSRCPSSGGLRKMHNGGDDKNDGKQHQELLVSSASCQLMDNTLNEKD